MYTAKYRGAIREMSFSSLSLSTPLSAFYKELGGSYPTFHKYPIPVHNTTPIHPFYLSSLLPFPPLLLTFTSQTHPAQSSFTMAAKVTIASGATWQEVAADRQAHRDSTISLIDPPLPEISDIPLNTLPLAKQVLTPEEIEITESTVEDLAATLAKGELSAVTVTKAFLRRAALAQKAVCSPPILSFTMAQCMELISPVQLHHRTPPKPCPRPRRVSRFLPRRAWQADRPSARRTHQRERTSRCERFRS